MIPVEQERFFDEAKGERGDCLAACLASLLELDLGSVPHFAGMGERWHLELTAWLGARGWLLGSAWHTISEDDRTRLDGYSQGYWLAGVTSLRTRSDGSNISHLVVMLDGEIAWDPHPARGAGHLGFDGTGWLLRPYDPARFVLRDDQPSAEDGGQPPKRGSV